MANLTTNYIKKYITKNYGTLRHDPTRLNKACKLTAKKYSFKPIDVFHFIIENEDFNGQLNSYGFNTAYGRKVKSTFEYNYYTI